ncbi:MAG: hypothetical protein ABIQ32_06830 [Sphingomicrobium sp.]
MATVATTSSSVGGPRPDVLSGTPRAHAVDRWIYVAMAAWFIAIVLVAFIPDSLGRIAAIQANQRPPFPLIAHVHAVLMGSFLLLLLAQTVLVATGRCQFHRRLGLTAMVLVPALVIAGLILAPTTYHGVWNGAHFGPPAAQAALTPVLPALENILLLQIRIGILFSLFLTLALRARGENAGLHKRMMFLGTAVALPAAIDRMWWLPTTLPHNAVATDLYVVAAVLPMFAWDVVRNRSVHRAYWVWGSVYLVASVVVNMLWDTPGWHATAQRIYGV